jgi:hypothetical protein
MPAPVPFEKQQPSIVVLLSYVTTHREFNVAASSEKLAKGESTWSPSYQIRAIAGIAQISTKQLVNTKDHNNKIPLQVAAEGGGVDWVEALLDAGADPRLLDTIRYHEQLGMRGVSKEAREFINAAIATKLAKLEEASRLTRAVSTTPTASTEDNSTVTSTALSRSSSHSHGSNDGESSPSAKVDCSGIQNSLLASLRGTGQAYSAESAAERWE